MNTVLASLCYVGVAHMGCATPAQRYADLCESGPQCVEDIYASQVLYIYLYTVLSLLYTCDCNKVKHHVYPMRLRVCIGPVRQV